MTLLVVEGSTLELAPAAGGSIAAWTWRGRSLLRPSDAAALAAGDARASASYPLVPYSNRIRDARFDYRERTIELARNFGDNPNAIHGVGWQRPWEVAVLIDRDHRPSEDELQAIELAGFDRDATEFTTGELAIALLEYEHYPVGDDLAAWPFAFTAEQCFTLAPGFLAVQMTVTNRDTAPMPLGLGWHPYFPRGDAELDLEVHGVWQAGADRLPLRYESPSPWRLARWRPAGELELDHCFRRVPDGRLSIRWPSRGLGVDIVAAEPLEHLVVYIPGGKDFLAIEPVSNMNDAFNMAAAGESGTGMLELEPDAAITATMILRPLAYNDSELQ